MAELDLNERPNDPNLADEAPTTLPSVRAAMALGANGQVYSWGANDECELGHTTSTASATVSTRK